MILSVLWVNFVSNSYYFIVALIKTEIVKKNCSNFLKNILKLKKYIYIKHNNNNSMTFVKRGSLIICVHIILIVLLYLKTNFYWNLKPILFNKFT